MKVKTIIDEDFSNYKFPSMFITTCVCDWKCPLEQSLDISICQNSNIVQMPTINICDKVIFNRYIKNPITESIVIGGLEPMLQFSEVIKLIEYFRNRGCDDEFVIYTGYNRDEIEDEIQILSNFKNVIVKFGRYMHNDKQHYDEVLGVFLASSNQKGEKIS